MMTYWTFILIAISTLLSASQSLLASHLRCQDIVSKPCGCSRVATPSDGFEVQCPKNNNVKYFPSDTLSLDCSPTPGFILDSEIVTNATSEPSGPLLQLPPVNLSNIKHVELLEVRFCDFSITLEPVEELIRVTKPAELKLLSMALPENLLKLIHQEELADTFKNMTRVYIKDTEMSEVPYEFLEQFTNLDLLTISRCGIVNVTGPFTASLKRLEFGDNRVRFISAMAFKGLVKLTTLELFYNQIEYLDPEVFSDLINIKSVELMGNNLTQIDGQVFMHLQNLQRLNLSRNKLKTVPEDLFSRNRDLVRLRISYNKLQFLPEWIFRENVKLKVLDLSFNQLQSLPEKIFGSLEELNTLNLQGNRLTILPGNLFKHLVAVGELFLGGNRIERIESQTFMEMNNLTTLDLSDNKLVQIDLITFVNQHKLKMLNLANNQISASTDNSFVNFLYNLEALDMTNNNMDYIPQDFYLSKPHMRELGLQRNKFTEFDFAILSDAISNISINLDYNNITRIYDMHKVDLQERNSNGNFFQRKRLSLRGNPLRCDSANFDLYRYFQKAMDPTFQQRYDINDKGLFCASPEDRRDEPFYLENAPSPCKYSYNIKECPNPCDCYYNPLDNKIIVYCANRGLMRVPKLFVPQKQSYEARMQDCHVDENTTHLEVILRGNHIKHLEPISFVNIHVNLTELDVSFNNLTNLTWIPQGLNTLKLDHNYLERIDKEILERLSNVTLNNNRWICDCKTVPFRDFLISHEMIRNKKEVYCVNTQISVLARDNLCPSHGDLIIAIIAVVILIPAICCIFFYKYNQEIKVWLYAHNMCLWCVRVEDLDKDKIYDAFISFSHKDEDFVADHLMSKLENIPDPYKLCVHMRNFIPGEFIAKQVADSVLNSRRTIVVLSPSFLDSVWGKMEFRAAHTKAITEGIARVIVILYDDVDLNDERIDEELRLYLKTNTYIRWGDPWFWDKLKYSLPHRKNLNNAAYVNKRFESVSANLDKMDKFNQNVPANIKQVVNPPVDPLLLRLQPDIKNTPPAEMGIV